MYWLLERLPSSRETARRLGLVTIEQMIHALVAAVEMPAHDVTIMGVQEIKGHATGNHKARARVPSA
jgi:hypothetical protein